MKSTTLVLKAGYILGQKINTYFTGKILNLPGIYSPLTKTQSGETSLAVQWLSKTLLPIQEAWIQSLVREPRSHMIRGMAKKFKKDKKQSGYSKSIRWSPLSSDWHGQSQGQGGPSACQMWLRYFRKQIPASAFLSYHTMYLHLLKALAQPLHLCPLWLNFSLCLPPKNCLD